MHGQLTATSRPYPWPWHGRFTPERTAFLAVRDGAMAPPHGATEALLASVARLAAGAGLTIGELPDIDGEPILANFAPDFIVARPHYGGFSGTDLHSILRKRRITDLIIAGFPFELGADCTMRQANDLGYECLALTDCCTGLAADTLAGAMSSIQMSGGIFGAVAESAAVLELFARVHEAQTTAASAAQPAGATP